MTKSLSPGDRDSYLNAGITVLFTVTQRQYALGLRLETILWIILLALSLWARLWDLDQRAMSHDESLHTFYSHLLYNEGKYEHDPMMHGPFLFHANALIYALMGVTDFTSRIMPALAGTLVVGCMWWFRRYLGQWGALTAGILVAISPSLLFHSRYIRNDIYVALFALLWVYSLLRYLDKGETKWMWGMGLGMLLGFISKENHFITGMIMGTFCGGLAVAAWWRPGLLGDARQYRLWDVTLVMALLVLPFLAPLVHYAFGWDPLDISRTGLIRSGVIAGLLGLVGLGLGILWFGKIRPAPWRSAYDARAYAFTFLGFWVIAELFFSTFLTHPRGLISGPVESLGYWLTQQEVQRGSQPWYYYFMLTALYEFLPFLFALLGGVLGVRAVVRTRRADPANAPWLNATGFAVMLLVWWGLLSWLAYSFAGERMPWLLTHMALPMCVLGGYGLGQMLTGFPRRPATWISLAALTAGLTCLVWTVALQPFGGRDLGATRDTAQWIGAFIAGIGLLVWSGRHIARNRQAGRSLVAAGVFLTLAILTLRASLALNFVNYDDAAEYLTYAHGSPDIKRALAEIEEISEALYGNKDIQVAYDDDNSWPMAWYFRDYPNARFYNTVDEPLLLSSPIVLVGPTRWEQIRPLMEQDYAKRTYRLIWWPEEAYKEWSWASLGGWLDPELRHRWKSIFFFRDHPHLNPFEWPHRREFDMFVRRDLAPLVWAEEADRSASYTLPNSAVIAANVPQREFPSLPAIEGEFAGLPLAQPRSIRVAADGRRVLTDSGNHRVLVLDRSHEMVLSLGDYCPLDSFSVSFCRDPDGAGPLEEGDGQFNEPWGAVLADSGLLYVADTWNHRIQVFDGDGRFVNKWGAYGQPDSSPLPDEPAQFFGPRGVEVLPDGNVVVVDTGNHRLQEFSPEGVLQRGIGSHGDAPGLFNEPVDGRSHAETGLFIITDNWNHRIQLLTLALHPGTDIDVLAGMWTSSEAVHKPYVAVVPDFGVVVSDPQNSRLVFFDLTDGQPLGVMDLAAADTDAAVLPLGLAFDPLTAELLVVDGNNSKVLVFDLSQATEGVEP